jgi:hypothetical protein
MVGAPGWLGVSGSGKPGDRVQGITASISWGCSATSSAHLDARYTASLKPKSKFDIAKGSVDGSSMAKKK